MAQGCCKISFCPPTAGKKKQKGFSGDTPAKGELPFAILLFFFFLILQQP